MAVLRICFLAAAASLIVLNVFCDAVYEWGTHVVRRWGWTGVARLRDRMKPWALPFSRVLLVLRVLLPSAAHK